MAGPPVAIRPYRRRDAKLLFTAARESTTEVYPWLSWCHPNYQLREARQWVKHQRKAWAAQREYQFAIVSDVSDGAFLGGCGVNQINRIHRFGNLGYWVRTSATGQGVATRAVASLVQFCRETTDLVRLEIVVAVGNEASARVAEKAGAQKEGLLRHRLLLHGTPSDATLYSFVLR